jgi:peptidoglycan/LPS O-acetylase OafA/YrhL
MACFRGGVGLELVLAKNEPPTLLLGRRTADNDRVRDPPPSARNPRLAGLDLLRLLAIVLVLGRHMPAPPPTWPVLWQSTFLAWQRGGWVGVDLFFVLSGFLVSGLLFAEYIARGQLSVWRFYIRRGWKIYPPFYALMAVTVIVNILSGYTISGYGLARELLFLQSYAPAMWNHTWSLAVEEHFYLLLPLVLALILQLNRKSKTPLGPVLPLAWFIAVFVCYLRLVNWQHQPNYSHQTHLFPTHLRLDSLFFGVAMSYMYHFRHSEFREWLAPRRQVLMVAGSLLLVPAFIFPLETTPFIYTGGLTVFYLGSGMLLAGVLLSEIPRHRIVTLLAMLGSYSYSIYLWHMFVIGWIIPYVQRVSGLRFGFLLGAALYVGGSLAFGVFMARLIEVPALAVRDRRFPALGDRRSRTSGAAPLFDPVPTVQSGTHL